MVCLNKKRYINNIINNIINFDKPLLLIIFSIMFAGIITLYSASLDFPKRIENQLIHIALTIILILIFSKIPQKILLNFAVPLYSIGIILLISVIIFGLTRKGAKRWINIGIIIQPSEILKIAVPLILSWYFQGKKNEINWYNYMLGFIILIIPVVLIAKQPDLGTALLVFSAGSFVIYFAGLNFKLIFPLLFSIILLSCITFLFQDNICKSSVNWPILHNYQKNRICTLLNPSIDPQGKGFHTIQSIIAIGSGGSLGKGWLKGTQTHLEFIPEKHTDFIFAVFLEEFGFIGGFILLILYSALIWRGLYIAINSSTLFGRLLAGSLTMTFFSYIFVNIGMVSGILPVVGVPLPFMSYGGTALITLGISTGLIMSVAKKYN